MPFLPLLDPGEGKMAEENNRNSPHPLFSPPPMSPFTRSRSPMCQEDGTPVRLDEGMATRSAFEITSVSHIPEENEDVEGMQAHVSKDADDLQGSLLEAGNNRYSNSSGDSEEFSETPIEHLSSNSHDNSQTPIESYLAPPTNPSPKPSDVTNGVTQVPQSRFRRVNQYLRGRWLVRDTLEPEEQRPESEMRMASLPTSSKNILENVATSPSISRKHQQTSPLTNTNTNSEVYSHNHEHSRSSSEVSNPIDLPSSNQPLSRDATSDKIFNTAESIHSLSRTGSMSSVVKSVDGDDRELGVQEDVESMAFNRQTPDIPTSVSQPSSTMLERSPAICRCDECIPGAIQNRSINDHQQSLEIAMCHLQQQLIQYLQCNEKTLLEHNKILEENERLKKQVQELELENKQLLTRLESTSQQNYESSTVPYS